MKNTHPQTTKDFSNLIGIPYSEKDCWGIATEFYREVFGVELKKYYDAIPTKREDAKELIASSVGEYRQVKDSEKSFGDLILIKLFDIDCHIAIYIGEGKILHTVAKSGCVIDRLDKWKHLIVGYYRVINND